MRSEAICECKVVGFRKDVEKFCTRVKEHISYGTPFTEVNLGEYKNGKYFVEAFFGTRGCLENQYKNYFLDMAKDLCLEIEVFSQEPGSNFSKHFLTSLTSMGDRLTSSEIFYLDEYEILSQYDNYDWSI